MSDAEVNATRPFLVSNCEPTGIFAAPVNGTKPFGAVARARPLPGSLMKTRPETTFATTDLPGTGGAGGGGGGGGGAWFQITTAVCCGSLLSRTPLPLRSVNAVSVSVPARMPVQLIAAVPSPPVVTAPAPGFAPAIE